jgi:hypothetical protein
MVDNTWRTGDTLYSIYKVVDPGGAFHGRIPVQETKKFIGYAKNPKEH